MRSPPEGALVALIVGLPPAFRCALNPAGTLAAALTGGLRRHTVPAYIVALTGYRIMTW